jgi:hypothetical protein
MGADVSWFVRLWTPGEVHRGVFNQGMVQAACDLVFFPLRVEGQVRCHRLPQAEQVCQACMVWGDNQVAIPAVCSRHPEEVISMVVSKLDRGRITLDSPHTPQGCAFTVTIDPLFNTLGEWL